MIAVLEVLPGERAIVSTKDLFRVQAEPSGRVLAELLPRNLADARARGFDGGECGETAKIVPYVA